MKSIDESNFHPLRGLVLVRRDMPEEEKGGIVIPDSWRQYGWRATVLRPGPDAKNYNKGDVVLFLKEFTVLPFKDRTLALTNAEHILAKLVIEAKTELIIPQNRFVLIEPHPTVLIKGGVYFSDKSKKPPLSGWVVRFGPDCHEVERQKTVWFEPEKGVTCVERGIPHRLIDEDNILAIQAGA